MKPWGMMLMTGLVLGPQNGGDTRSSPGSRSPVLAPSVMVATSQPLASAAALRVLEDGGNAVDAAIAAAAVLSVVEPMMTGLGGDMFALLHMRRDGKPVGLNASGWSGSRATIEFMQSRGFDAVPDSGVYSVSVPGAVAGWFALHERYGSIPMSRLLDPAIQYAEDGFPVSRIVATQWKLAEDKLRASPGTLEAYLVSGRAPRHGEIFRSPNLARALRLVAGEGRHAFYEGEIARNIIELSDRNDGLLRWDDLSEYQAEWVEPICSPYREYEVCELPPNTQGLTVLEMLNILEGFDVKALGHNSADYIHLLVEAKKIAFEDRDTYVSDPRRADVPLDRLVSKEYARERRQLIQLNRAMRSPQPGQSPGGDTVYLTVVDAERNAVSFINSLFHSFGSGLVAGNTGIVLHNRGTLFVLDPHHRNRLEARKRPLHTLIPAMVLKDGKPCFSFGVMGGDMQPQGHVQVLLNLIEFGMDVQQAGEAFRVRHAGDAVFLELGIDDGVEAALGLRGHRVLRAQGIYGGYQGILIDPTSGVLVGGSDPRKDGLAIGR